MSDPIPDPIHLGLSFDDVLLVPQHSGVLPTAVDVSTKLTDKTRLNIPVISSAMDTVTESDLAIALAREGGLGVIHRNCPPAKQAEFVERVKRSENMVIQDPILGIAAMALYPIQAYVIPKLQRQVNMLGKERVKAVRKLSAIRKAVRMTG